MSATRCDTCKATLLMSQQAFEQEQLKIIATRVLDVTGILGAKDVENISNKRRRKQTFLLYSQINNDKSNNYKQINIKFIPTITIVHS